jgi:hypothetical protein
MSVEMESFEAAWAKLSSLGLDLTRASFEIGWELAHLADTLDQTPAPADDAGTYKEILSVKDLTHDEDMLVRVERIAAALWTFNNHLQNKIPSDTDLTVPDFSSLKKAVAAEKADDIGVQLAALHIAMVKACAALDGTAIAGQNNSPDLSINGLKESYEVGRLLAVIVLEASRAQYEKDFLKYLSIAPAKIPRQEETAAFRVHSMLGGLRDCFPSAAAYSVARHLEDWSDWISGNPVDYAERFDPAQGQMAIRGQGRVWTAILSGQTLARDFIVAESVADAANRLFVSWAANATAIARSFLRTALARFFLILGVIVLLVFVGAFLIDLLTQGGVTSGAKNGLTITAILAAVASAGGIFHVSRTQVTSALGDIWSMVEPPMVEAELIESIALSTRRLPLDTVGGAAPPQAKTMKDRLERARRGSLPQLPQVNKQAGKDPKASLLADGGCAGNVDRVPRNQALPGDL